MIVSLRDASVDDRDEVERHLADYLFEFDGRSGRYPDLDGYWADRERLPFLIDAAGRSIGVCLIRCRDGGWSIAEFFVEASHRRAGVGRAAVEAIVQRAGEAGARHVDAKVHPDNGEAFLFWSAVGFEQVPSTGTTGVLITRRQL